MIAPKPLAAPFVVDREPHTGIYRVTGDSYCYDSELGAGLIELYQHPIRGLSYWDELCDDGTDFSGHIAWYFLQGMTIQLVKAVPNDLDETDVEMVEAI